MTQPQLLRRVAGWTPRYLIVSIACFLGNNLLLIALDALGVPLWLSVIISACVLILVGFALQALVTFAAPLRWSAFWRYALAMLPNVPLAFALLWLLRDWLGLAMYWAAPAVSGLMFLWNGIGSIWALGRHSRR